MLAAGSDFFYVLGFVFSDHVDIQHGGMSSVLCCVVVSSNIKIFVNYSHYIGQNVQKNDRAIFGNNCIRKFPTVMPYFCPI